MAKKDDKKIMDVAKPGEGKQSIGSKPMIIGHSAANDPMVKEDGSTDEKKSTEPPSKTRKVISPISDDVKPEESEDTAAEQTQASEDKTTEESPKEADSSEEAAADTDVKEDSSETSEKKDADENTSKDSQNKDEDTSSDEKVPEETAAIDEQASTDDAAAENKVHLDRLVESKKYFVTIHSDRQNTSMRVQIISFFATLLIGALIAAALIDAEIIDLGITLPFDFL